MKKSELKQLIKEVLQENASPKYHQSEDGKWVILDMPNTPFWYARFYSEDDAKKAYDLWIKATKGPSKSDMDRWNKEARDNGPPIR